MGIPLPQMYEIEMNDVRSIAHSVIYFEFVFVLHVLWEKHHILLDVLPSVDRNNKATLLLAGPCCSHFL